MNMVGVKNSQIDKVYGAKTKEESAVAYDDWSKKYEDDLFSYGLRYPFVLAAVCTRFANPEDGPILDAGCGTGLQAELLHLAGYTPIVGIDLSVGMLNVAIKKNIYSELHTMTLGERLDFDDNAFAHTISAGAITPGHAPPHAFDELIRVTRQGGLVVFNLRVDDDQDPAYPAIISKYENANRWKMIFQTAPFKSMPLGESNVITRVYVYKII